MTHSFPTRRSSDLILITLLVAGSAMAQQRGVPVGDSDEFSYLNPQNYITGGVTVSGTEYLDNDVLITISKLVVGSRIEVPSDATSRSEEHTSELQSLMRISYAVFCLKK